MNEASLELLEKNVWLNSLPVDSKNELIRVAKIKNFTENQRIHNKNDEADGLYCVLTGEVRISATSHVGNEIIFTRIQAGNWYGEIGILDNGGRTHDGFSVTDTELVIIPKSTIQTLCNTNMEVYRALVAMLCSHCRMAFHAIDELLIYSNEQRLANIIINRSYQEQNAVVNISQEELGLYIGISRQSINKILKSWQFKGLIKRVYGGVEIIDLNSLQGICK